MVNISTWKRFGHITCLLQMWVQVQVQDQVGMPLKLIQMRCHPIAFQLWILFQSYGGVAIQRLSMITRLILSKPWFIIYCHPTNPQASQLLISACLTWYGVTNNPLFCGSYLARPRQLWTIYRCTSSLNNYIKVMVSTSWLSYLKP